MRLKTTIATTAAADAAFDYLADFRRIEEWDPFIGRALALDPGPPRVGSRYDVFARGGRPRLRYEVVALDPGARRIRLTGSATGFRGWDEVTVRPRSGGGSAVTYEAEIELHGAGRVLYLLAPIALLAFALGGNPLRGMRRRLDGLARTAKRST